jgi:hypothetical protein
MGRSCYIKEVAIMARKEVDPLCWFCEVSDCQTNRVGRDGQVYEVTWLHGRPGKWDHLFR